MQVVGVDGWRRGWVGVVLEDGEFRRAWVAGDAAGMVAASGAATVIGIDVPIGLPAEGTRACDRAGRRLLAGRSSSLFPTPPRVVIEAEPYTAANALSKERFGFGISRQAYGLRTKVLDVDAVDDRRLREVHPELSFLAMAGTVLPAKKTWAGMTSRRRALRDAGIVIPGDLGPAGLVPVDDVLDAAAAAWTAHRIACGEATAVPDEIERDEIGRRMAIWF